MPQKPLPSFVRQLGTAFAIAFAAGAAGTFALGLPDGPVVAPAGDASSVESDSTAPFIGSADLRVSMLVRDDRNGINARGMVPISADAPVRASANYLDQPKRLDLDLRFPSTERGATGPQASLHLRMSIPNYGGVGSYPIHTFKGGVDASAFGRQVVLILTATDTVIPQLPGIRNRVVQFENSHHWSRNGRYEAFDDIGGAIHILEVRGDRVLAEVEAVLYPSWLTAPGFAGFGEDEARAQVSGRIEFAAFGEIPR